ncbi:uncharacterized protein LOC141638149 [Silene latifolia]|uniref:uncharacterized protein LOC141638149 n=1 Tax=Silene latifolia TaxID=37657 RepID=UPI003D7795BF
MRTFCWNCRGLGDADSPAIPYLRWCVRKYGVSILFLQEMMCSFETALTKTNPLDFPNFCGVDAIGLSGGLLLRWSNDVSLVPIELYRHFILCKLSIVYPSIECYIIFLYGEPNVALRNSLWERLSNISRTFSPVVLVGDFNQVEFLFDKLGGSNNIRGQFDFINWKLDNDLLDIPFYGPPFTWMNCRHDNSLLLERLDKAYASSQWLLLFPSAYVLHLPILVSDHAPIILHFLDKSKPSRRPYRLDNWCLSHPEIE